MSLRGRVGHVAREPMIAASRENVPAVPREVLDSGGYGPLVAVDDRSALADALAETLDRPPDSSMLRERARYFSIERSASCYLERAEALVAGREFRDT